MQAIVPAVSAAACGWIWPHSAPPGHRVTVNAAYTTAGIGNGRAAIIPAVSNRLDSR
jgi:hypothetical protein